MKKILRYTSFFGGIVITLLGIIILLIQNDTGQSPTDLISFTLILVFLIGLAVISYIVLNKGV